MRKEMLNDLVAVEIEENKHAIKDFGSVKFRVDTSYNEMGTENAVQDGIVRSVPARLTQATVDESFHLEEIPEMRLKVGDRVFCHHHIMEYAIVKDRIRMIPYHLVYCTVNDSVITMMDPWNLLVPVENIRQSAFKIKGDEYQMAMVKHSCPTLNKEGINDGDIVIYRPGADCELKIDDQYFYRVITSHIIAKVHGS